MKKTIILLLTSVAFAQAMQESDAPASMEQAKFEHWTQLPTEIQELILSFVPDINNYQDYQNLLLTDKRISALVSHPRLRKAFIQATLMSIIKQKPTTALALLQGQRNLVDLLLHKGADVNAQGNGPINALLAATDPEIITMLIKAGSNLELVNHHGDTVLLWAVYANEPEIVNLLLQAGANTDVRDRNGKTPLQLAEQRGHAEVIKILKLNEAGSSSGS